MEILTFSDLHGTLPDINKMVNMPGFKFDVACIAGDTCPDFSWGIPMEEYCERQAEWLVKQFIPWSETVPAKQILMVWGNHDFLGDRYPKYIPTEALKAANITVLTNQSVTIDKCVFHGSPWCLPVGKWAFLATEEEFVKHLALVPDNVNVLISHTPPYGMHDKVKRGNKSVGSKTILEYIKDEHKWSALRLVLCGHIHEGYGKSHIGYVHRLPTTVANVSLLDENYSLKNAPMSFSVDLNATWTIG